MIERTLNQIGLTEYETKIYLYLVRNGTTKAVEISKRTGVPFGRVYDILYQLEAKGFIKVVLTQPKQFSPIPPRAALSSALNQLKEEYNAIANQTEKDMQELQHEFSSQQKAKKPVILLVTGERNIKELRRRELVIAKGFINAIVSPGKSTRLAPTVERLAREASKRGVKRRLIENPTTKPEREKVKMKLAGGAEIRFWPYEGFTLSIVDSREVRIEVEDPMHGRASVLIEHENLAKALNEFFEYKWSQSKPVDKNLLKRGR